MKIYNSFLPKLFGYDGITIWPFIFFAKSRRRISRVLICHEEIHLKQQRDWFVIPFFIVYIFDYIYNRLKGMDHDKAYRNIRFEKEAYERSK